MSVELGAVSPPDTPADIRLAASRRFAIAEYFRIPYRVAPGEAPGPTEQLRAQDGAALYWPGTLAVGHPVRAAWIEGTSDAGGAIPIFGRILPDSLVAQLAAEKGGDWSPSRTVRDSSGERLGSIWADGTGNVLLPFDPDEIIENYWSERYVALTAGTGRSLVRHGLIRSYYRTRVVLPRGAQIWLRRRYAHFQARTEFPDWPIETALHDFFDLLLGLIASVAGHPLPYLAPWPKDRRWALILTHDVETAAGLRAVQPILELERSLGVRSCWNFVPHRYEVDDGLVRELITDGFEVGVHGLRHDGRDLRSLSEIMRRLPAIREAARRWDAVGFRAPAMHRNWNWMPRLGFEYDCSSPDTDPFEPQGGGCCSWLPFFNQDTLELPLTMPQDHTLFVILGQSDETTWVEKAEFLRAQGGMAQILTHPDYMGDPRIMRSYRRLLEHFAGDGTAWTALPGEVNRWWRRRAASTIEATPSGWAVAGPAAGEAAIDLLGSPRPLVSRAVL